jgi:hypothetical protein
MSPIMIWPFTSRCCSCGICYVRFAPRARRRSAELDSTTAIRELDLVRAGIVASWGTPSSSRRDVRRSHEVIQTGGGVTEALGALLTCAYQPTACVPDRG